MKNIKIGILIPVFNHIDFTKTCLDNLRACLTENKLSFFEIILCDDGSTDGTSNWVQQMHPEVHLAKGDGNLWWSGGINMAAKYASEQLDCSHVLLWNNDIEIDADYFIKLIEFAGSTDENTIVGSKIYANKEKTIVWSMGGHFNPRTGKSFMYGYMQEDSDDFKKNWEVDWITGMGTLVPVKAIHQIGYWDAVNFPQYHGDTEFTYRAKLNNFKLLISPELTIYNDVSNTGLVKKEKLKDLIKLLSDKRSALDFKVNRTFIKLYGKGFLSNLHLIQLYFRTIGGFFKWKLFGVFGIRKK